MGVRDGQAGMGWGGGAEGQGTGGPHLDGHVGAVPVEVVELPVEGDVVAAAVDGAGVVAHPLAAGPAAAVAGAGESGERDGGLRGRPRPAAGQAHPHWARTPQPVGVGEGGAPARGTSLGAGGRPGQAGGSPGVAVHCDMVAGRVQFLVVRAGARLLLHAAPPAVVHQPLGAHAAADALCLVLRADGGQTRSSAARLTPAPRAPSPPRPPSPPPTGQEPEEGG